MTTASKMPERPRPHAVTKPATCAGKKQHGRRRISSETHVTETTICSFRREVSVTTSSEMRVDSTVEPRRSPMIGSRASGSTRSTRTNARQPHPLERGTPSAGEAKKRRQPSASHICDLVQEKWTDFGVLCALQLVSGLAGWHDEPRVPNAKWCKEWKGTEWRDLVLADLVRPTLEGLILACCHDAEGIMDCVHTGTDGGRIFKVKDSLTVRTRESEHHWHNFVRSTVITMMVRSRSNDVIWKKRDRQTPSLSARPTRYPDATLFSAGASTSGNEVKVTSPYVVERTTIVASLMPKGGMGRPNEETRRPATRSEQNETCVLQRDSTERRFARDDGTRALTWKSPLCIDGGS